MRLILRVVEEWVLGTNKLVPGELVRCQDSTQCHIVTPKRNNNSLTTGAGVSFQMDSHYFSVLEGASSVQRERLPRSLGQTQLTVAGSNETWRREKRGVKTVKEE